MAPAFRGELVFTFLHDLGGEVRLPDAARLLSSVPVARAPPSKSAPSYVELVHSLLLEYPPRPLETDHGPFDVRVEARVYAIGAIGVRFRIPFVLPDLAALNRVSHLRPRDGPDLLETSRRLTEELAVALKPALVETYHASVEPEHYLTIVLTETDAPARELMVKESRLLAGLLTGDRRPERLSEEEVHDNLRTWFRYYEDDLVVVDWDRTLVVEPSGRYEDVLQVVEAANLELLELRAYDRYLDSILESAYSDITRFYGRGGLFRSARNVQEELSNARIDLVRVTDTINNIGKIFGDYYLAKLHLGLAERFHLREWETIVREKMATLNELYTLASHEVEHRRGVVLESMIILLFIIDLALIYVVSGG